MCSPGKNMHPYAVLPMPHNTPQSCHMHITTAPPAWARLSYYTKDGCISWEGGCLPFATPPSVGHSFVTHKRMVHLMGVFPSLFGAIVAVMLLCSKCHGC